jgi:glucokinase
MVIGVDIGGTKIAAGVVDDGGAVLLRRERATPAREGAMAVVAAVGGLVAELRRAHPGIEAVGVGSAGQVDGERGVIVTTGDSLPGFSGLALCREVAALVGLPVSLENDVSAAALAEARLGAGRGARGMLMIMAGTGIGGAMILEGKIYRGVRGLGGEFGHMPLMAYGGRRCPCGRRGCVEAYAAGRAIVATYGAATGAGEITALEIARRAEAGDRAARQALGRAGRALGRAAAGLVNALNPDVLVLGGGVLGAGEYYTVPMQRALRESALPACYEMLTVQRAVLGGDAVLVGAALRAAAQGV